MTAIDSNIAPPVGSKRISDREAIRLALHHAIDERESLIDSYGQLEPGDDSYRWQQQWLKQVEAFRRVLRSRYNESH